VDASLLKQAILNLMLNATQAMTDGAKSPSAARGELILRVESHGDESRLHVIDTGPGISPDKIEDIFRPYVSMRTGGGGTGLGLPTARRIVQEHGGELTVHSEPGKGSDFVIHLPRKR
jgi:signal transduction histidine kinase